MKIGAMVPEQYFPLVWFLVPYKMTLTFDSGGNTIVRILMKTTEKCFPTLLISIISNIGFTHSRCSGHDSVRFEVNIQSNLLKDVFEERDHL